MAEQLGFLINLDRCIGCHSCEFACKNDKQLNDFAYRRVLNLKKQENVFAYLSMACNHCANPQCIRVCPEKCYRKLRNGVVLHDPAKCDGCQSCTGACPFRVPQ
ncbi:MAG: 4Fe-4S dicluster domain-containing protein, partial [Bacillota bacterium]